MASKFGQTKLSLILKALINAQSGATGEPPRVIQQAMADAAGIQRGTVLQILRGDIKHPPKARLRGFADVLTGTPDQAAYLFNLLTTTVRKA